MISQDSDGPLDTRKGFGWQKAALCGDPAPMLGVEPGQFQITSLGFARERNILCPKR
jgi:hypothetical protein